MSNEPIDTDLTEPLPVRRGESLFAINKTALTRAEAVEMDERFAALPGEDRTNLYYIRDLAPSESEASAEAHELLGTLTVGSRLADLRLAHDHFHEEIDRAEQEALDGKRTPALSDVRLQRAFRSWLSSFRSFDYHTTAWLSRTWGKQSDVYGMFQRLLSHEFDHNFAYRLCCALRNASEHEADVLSVGLESAGNRETGEVTREVTIRVDGPRLAERFPKVRAATRAELRECTAPLEVEWVVGAIDASCERVHCELFTALTPEIEMAIALCDGFHGEALAAGGMAAVFIPTQYAYKPDPHHMTMRINPQHLADKAREVSDAVEGLLARPAEPDVTWMDFVRS